MNKTFEVSDKITFFCFANSKPNKQITANLIIILSAQNSFYIREKENQFAPLLIRDGMLYESVSRENLVLLDNQLESNVCQRLVGWLSFIAYHSL